MFLPLKLSIQTTRTLRVVLVAVGAAKSPPSPAARRRYCQVRAEQAQVGCGAAHLPATRFCSAAAARKVVGG